MLPTRERIMRRWATATAAGLLAVSLLGGCATHRHGVARTRGRSGAPPPMTRVDALSGPHFAYAKAELTPEGQAKVRNVAQALNQYPNRRIQVNGYTDSTGDDARNQRLAERRADTVKQTLIESGVNPSRITATGYGSANPVASDATAEGRAQNRRVEIILE